MGHSREDKALSRERILKSASQRIREHGLDGLSVAELMKSAGLTHGGFYGHFPSRQDVVLAGLERALSDGDVAALAGERGKATRTVRSVVNGYLSVAHRDEPSAGCAVAAVGGEVARSDPAVRKVMAGKIERSLESMASIYGGEEEAEEFAMAAWSTMVGALVLSRVLKGDPKSERILAAAKSSVMMLEAAYRDADTPDASEDKAS